jgi:soluble lytic murein transglycosylase-like protein
MKIPLILSAFLAQSIFSQTVAAKFKAENICEKHISAASAAQDVPMGLLYAVALTETGSGGQLQPFALNIEGEPFLAKSAAEAISVFQLAREDEKQLIDLGCMQINYYYHHAAFRTVDDMFDPKQNVNYAAKLLKNLRQKHGSWTEAVARYHASPKNRKAQHRYVCKVLNNMVATNFGGWTPAAKAFCEAKVE